MCKFKDGKYWIEVNYGINPATGKRHWQYVIKVCNGRIDLRSKFFPKRSLCVNNAKRFQAASNLVLREQQ